MAATYYTGAQLGFALTFPSSPLSVIWPPNAFVLVMLLLVPLRLWGFVLLAVAPAHMLVAWQNGLPVTTALGLYVTNCAEATLAACLVRRLSGGAPWLVTLRQTVVYVAGAVILAPLVTSFLDAGIQVLTRTGNDYWLLWQERLLSDALTLLTVPPALLIATSRGRSLFRRIPLVRRLEATLLAAGILAAGILVFGPFGPGPADQPLLVYETLPLLLWAAVRFGVGGTSAALLGVTLLASMWSTGYGTPTPETLSLAVDILILQAHLLAMSIPVFLLAAVIQERKRTEEALYKSRERYRAFFDLAAVGASEADPATGRLLQVNDAFCQITGYPREEMPRLSFRDLTHPDDREEDWRRFRRAVEEGRRTQRTEKRYVRKDGQTIWVQIDRAIVRDEAGQPIHTAAIIQDITERKRLEQEREEARAEAEQKSEELDRVFETMADGVIVFDAQGQIVRENAAMRRLVGMDGAPPDYYRQSLSERMELFAARDVGGRPLRSDEGPLPRVLRGEVLTGAETMDLRSRRLDGREMVLNLSVAPLRDREGRLMGAVSLFRDHTERVQMEDALRASEQRFRAAFESAGTGMVLVDTSGRVVQVNRPYCAMLGYSEEELCSQSFAEYTHPDDLAVNLARFHQALAGEIDSYQLEKRYIHKQGQIVWGMMSAGVVRDDSGQLLFIVGQVQDITKRKQAEQALEQLTARLLQVQDEERRRIARDLHDGTAQTLAAIDLNLTTLRALARTGVRDTNRFERLLADSQAMGAQAMRDMRTMSYLLHPPELDEVGLIPALEWYVKGFSQRSGIHVDLLAPKNLDRLPMEVERALFRVIQECLNNVRRHSGSSSARIALKRRRNAVHLVVVDFGRGLGDASPAATEASPGDVRELGVGIPGMRQRLRQLGGRLGIRSTTQGTVVMAVVPLHGAALGETHPAAPIYRPLTEVAIDVTTG